MNFNFLSVKFWMDTNVSDGVKIYSYDFFIKSNNNKIKDISRF